MKNHLLDGIHCPQCGALCMDNDTQCGHCHLPIKWEPTKVVVHDEQREPVTAPIQMHIGNLASALSCALTGHAATPGSGFAQGLQAVLDAISAGRQVELIYKD